MPFNAYRTKSGKFICADCRESYETRPDQFEPVEDDVVVEVHCSYCLNDIEEEPDD